MEKYQVTIKDREGKEAVVAVDAESRQQAIKLCREKGDLVLKIEPFVKLTINQGAAGRWSYTAAMAAIKKEFKVLLFACGVALFFYCFWQPGLRGLLTYPAFLTVAWIFIFRFEKKY